MLRFVSGNLFDSKAQALVNTVNCVGVMGKGVALVFRERFPEMFEDYRQQCERLEVRPGVLTIYKDTKPWVITFPTKRHWRGNSRIQDIEAGLATLVERTREWDLRSLALPALGCGNGGLDWADVRPLIERYLTDLDIDIEVYEPPSASPAQAESDRQTAGPVDLFGEPLNATPRKVGRRKRTS
jgi:O-acetyl-ADP-ribose deacetylase (regulator of RNase III)